MQIKDSRNKYQQRKVGGKEKGNFSRILISEFPCLIFQ